MLALLFQVGSARLAVDVRRVREVVPRVALASAESRGTGLAGHFVYRGRIVPVYDLHQLHGASECPPHLSSRIILCPHPDLPEHLVGLLAARVADVRELPERDKSAGDTIADGSMILHWFDPVRFIRSVAPHPEARA